jgi:hypothetical protein
MSSTHCRAFPTSMVSVSRVSMTIVWFVMIPLLGAVLGAAAVLACCVRRGAVAWSSNGSFGRICDTVVLSITTLEYSSRYCAFEVNGVC